MLKKRKKIIFFFFKKKNKQSLGMKRLRGKILNAILIEYDDQLIIKPLRRNYCTTNDKQFMHDRRRRN
jgi:hypothetical protein